MRFSNIIDDSYPTFSCTRFIKACIIVVCNFAVVGAASSALHTYNQSESVTSIAKVQESLVLTEGIISFIMGNLMPANDGRYPLWTAIFGILITAIPLAIRIVTTGFDGDTSKIGIDMPSHKVITILMIICLVVWVSLIQFEFDIEITAHWPFIRSYNRRGITVAVNNESTTTTERNNTTSVTRHVSALSRVSTLPRYTPPEELPLYTKNPELPPVYEELQEIRTVEPAVISEEPGTAHHEDHNNTGRESSIQPTHNR